MSGRGKWCVVLAMLVATATAGLAANRVLVLDGSGDGVSISTNNMSHLDLPYRAPISLCAWVNFGDRIPTNPAVVIHDWRAYLFQFNGAADSRFFIDLGGGYTHFSGTTAWQTNRWYHIAFTHDGNNTGQFFLNGESLNTTTNGGRHFGTQTNVVIGMSAVNTAACWRGRLDEISLWGKQLSRQEILDCMSRQMPASAAGLYAYWNFDDGTAKDATTNGHDGVFLGNATTAEDDNGVLRLTDCDRDGVCIPSCSGNSLQLSSANSIALWLRFWRVPESVRSTGRLVATLSASGLDIGIPSW